MRGKKSRFGPQPIPQKGGPHAPSPPRHAWHRGLMLEEERGVGTRGVHCLGAKRRHACRGARRTGRRDDGPSQRRRASRRAPGEARPRGGQQADEAREVRPSSDRPQKQNGKEARRAEQPAKESGRRRVWRGGAAFRPPKRSEAVSSAASAAAVVAGGPEG